MRLHIREIHVAPSKDALNEEWFVVENPGDKPFSTAGCTVAVGRGKGRLRPIGTLDPGFTLGPNEKMRVITGNPGRKAHGVVPDDDVKNYHLFLAAPLLQGAGSVLVVSLHQHELARATFDPKAPAGVASGQNGA
ncbi:MAG TPA: hypothetical protein VKE22_11880 [Haliangiales bacterium]|nr:hypothetical protein [Haliangiales bacterium]